MSGRAWPNEALTSLPVGNTYEASIKIAPSAPRPPRRRPPRQRFRPSAPATTSATAVLGGAVRDPSGEPPARPHTHSAGAPVETCPPRRSARRRLPTSTPTFVGDIRCSRPIRRRFHRSKPWRVCQRRAVPKTRGDPSAPVPEHSSASAAMGNDSLPGAPRRNAWACWSSSAEH